MPIRTDGHWWDDTWLGEGGQGTVSAVAKTGWTAVGWAGFDIRGETRWIGGEGPSGADALVQYNGGAQPLTTRYMKADVSATPVFMETPTLETRTKDLDGEFPDHAVGKIVRSSNTFYHAPRVIPDAQAAQAAANEPASETDAIRDQYQYPEITLDATAALGWEFSAWDFSRFQGEVLSVEGPRCVVRGEVNGVIGAEFIRWPKLDMRVSGCPDPQSNPYTVPSEGGEWYVPGTPVAVEAVADPEACCTFSHWEGEGIDADGNAIQGSTSPLLTIEMNEDRALVAVFSSPVSETDWDWKPNPTGDVMRIKFYPTCPLGQCPKVCCGELRLRQYVRSVSNSSYWNKSNLDQYTWHIDSGYYPGYWYPNYEAAGRCIEMTDSPILPWVSGGGVQIFEVQAFCCPDPDDPGGCTLLDTFRWHAITTATWFSYDVEYGAGWPAGYDENTPR